MRSDPHVVIMAVSMLYEFSSNGEYFSHSSPDGTLQLWDTLTGRLKQEYTPSSHLSAICTCFAWGSLRISRTSEKCQERRSREPVQMIHLVAMGTSSGTVVIYNVSKGDLEQQLEGGHTDVVNDVCWQSKHKYLFTCSTDQHIIQWCLATSKVKERWKADTAGVHAICLCNSEEHILSAGRSIKLWQLKHKTVLQTFSGHATEVFRLIHLSSLASEQSDQPDGSYFMSAAKDDRLINAWQVNVSRGDKNSLASFVLPEQPVYMKVCRPSHNTQSLLLLVLTRAGELAIYEHTLNGRCKKPLKPRITVQIATEGGVGVKDVPRPIPILCVHVADDSTILLAYGPTLRPVFEKLPYKSLHEKTCLLRSDPNQNLLYTQQQVNNLKTPAVSEELKLLAPGFMMPSGPARTESGKRKKSREVPMCERLRVMGTSDKVNCETRPEQMPKANTLVTLLAQGLQSNDKNILQEVLQKSDDTIIEETVQRLPVEMIVPLLQQLTVYMNGHANRGQIMVKWLKYVLTLHTSYLMTFPELVQLLSTLYQMMDSRIATFSRLSKLHGKLDLMLAQTSSQSKKEEEFTSQPPLCTFQDESSDEDVNMDGMFPDHSDSEDDWEDSETVAKSSSRNEEEDESMDEDDDD